MSEVELRAKLAALDRVQAVIEFTPQGEILTANENFLQAFGYELAELQGKHHKMLCEEQFQASAAYGELWSALRRGEFQSGEFLRIGKGGRKVWIQASYTLVADAQGVVVKVLKFATDITVAKTRNAANESLARAINRSQATIEFTPEGTVVRANENFLAAMGYRLEEIEGKHHRMFCDKAYVRTAEYAEF